MLVACSGYAPAKEISVSAQKVSVVPNPEGISFGFWANNSKSDGVFADFGRRPIERYGFFSWKAIETAPGVYDTDKIVKGVGHLHTLGTSCIIALNNISGPWFNKAKGSQIPDFYPQDIRDSETRRAGLRYIHSVIQAVLRATGELNVCFDYEMMWHCKPDTPEKQVMLRDWFLDAAAEARLAASEIGMADALKIMPIVNGSTEDKATVPMLNSPSENHVPAQWLTDIVSVCDYLAIDTYDFNMNDRTNPEKTINTLSFWIRHYSQGKPVQITEFGYSTGNTPYPDYQTTYHATGTEEQQEGFYKNLFPLLLKENIPGGRLNGQVRSFCFWMYSDMNTKKDAYQRENYFGLKRIDGSPKPGFFAVKKGIDSAASSVQSPSVVHQRIEVSLSKKVELTFTSGTEYEYIELTNGSEKAVKARLTVVLENPGSVIVETPDGWLHSSEEKTSHVFDVRFVPGRHVNIMVTSPFFPVSNTVKSITIR